MATKPIGLGAGNKLTPADDASGLSGLPATTGLSGQVPQSNGGLGVDASALSNGVLVKDGGVFTTTLAPPAHYAGTVNTANAAPTTVLTSTYSVPSNTVSIVDAWITVKRSDFAQSAGWHMVGLFRNNGGTVTQDGDTDFLDQPPQLQSAAWGGGVPEFVISGANINVQVTGVAATNYTWAARLAVYEN